MDLSEYGYSIHPQQLGSGSFGRVLLATAKTNTRVAIKFSEDGKVKDLRAEYDLLRTVAHPNVAVVTDLLAGRRLCSLPRADRTYKAGMIMEAVAQDLGSF